MYFCSDQEKVINNGIRKSFPFSIIIYCNTNLQRNISSTVDSIDLSKKINKLVKFDSLQCFNIMLVKYYKVIILKT